MSATLESGGETEKFVTALGRKFSAFACDFKNRSALYEFIGKANKLDGGDSRVKAKLEQINAYAPSPGVPDDKMLSMTKLAVVLDDFVATNDLNATAIQCWTSLQQNYGCNVCTAMSMMSQALMPSA